MESRKEAEEILKTFKERIIKDFLDSIIMVELENRPLSGYDIISMVFERFRFLASSGTVYSLLYTLERKGLVEGALDEKKRMDKLTEKGKFTVETIMSEPYMQYCARTLRKSTFMKGFCLKFQKLVIKSLSPFWQLKIGV